MSTNKVKIGKIEQIDWHPDGAECLEKQFNLYIDKKAVTELVNDLVCEVFNTWTYKTEAKHTQHLSLIHI